MGNANSDPDSRVATTVRGAGYFCLSSMLLRMTAAISSFAKSKTVSPSPVFASVLAPSDPCDSDLGIQYTSN